MVTGGIPVFVPVPGQDPTVPSTVSLQTYLFFDIFHRCAY